MSFRCEICGKGALKGNSVSHAHNKSRKFSMPNLHTIHVKTDDRCKRVTICSRCLRSGKVVKAV